MICFSGIRARNKNSQIWSCTSCWASFHIPCIHSWIRKSNENMVAGQYQWPCPGCRHIHLQTALPEYRCFCGQERDPHPSPHHAAHSCGQVCGRARPNCPHPCTALCHAGPCNPCAVINATRGECYCGAQVKAQTRCGEPKTWSCRSVCGKELTCGSHTCELKCHAGLCPPCAVENSCTCFCGRATRDLHCGTNTFTCNSICDKELACGAHACARTCHPGSCGECPWTPALWGNKCACGATASKKVRKTCADALETCNNICGIAQSCGHKCERSCHEDACGNCLVQVKQDCRCKTTKRTESCHIVLSGPYLCKTACKTKKTCNRHRCTTVCCEAKDARLHEAHLCIQLCGKPLLCGEHTCEEFCHIGTCPPCRVVRRHPLTCGCGDAVIEPPIPCGTQAPFCPNTCGAEMSCGHRCPALCHVDSHPPCTHLVTRVCAGKHTELTNIPCHVTVSCNKPCDRLLNCGHRCTAKCHSFDTECPPCTAPCGASRVHCEHPCDQLCHPGSFCGESPCTVNVQVTCLCGEHRQVRQCRACEATGPRSKANLKCLPAFCGTKAPKSKGSVPTSEGTKYLQPMVLEWRQHRKFLPTVEVALEEVISTRSSRTITCASVRKNLVCAIAFVYYMIDATASPSEDFFIVTLSPTSRMHSPAPKLSSVLDDDTRCVILPTSSPAVVFKDFPSKLESRVQAWIYSMVNSAEPFHLVLTLATVYTCYFSKAGSASQVFQRITGQGVQFENVAPVRASGTPDKLRLSLVNVPFLALRGKQSSQLERERREDVVEDAW